MRMLTVSKRERETTSIGHLKQTDVRRVSLLSRRYLFVVTRNEGHSIQENLIFYSNENTAQCQRTILLKQ